MSRSIEAPALRPAEAGDAQDLRDCARAAYALYLPRMDREPAPVLADYPALIAAGEVEVLVFEGRTAGFIVTRPFADSLFIENLAVWPDLQGRGLGRFLINRAEERALALGKALLRLYTNAVMTENLPFYESLDFDVEERRLEDGYHRIYFVKHLKEPADG